MVISVWVGTWWRSLDNKPTYRLILTATWCFQVRFWSIKIPRYFTDSLRSRETYLFLSLSNMVIFGWKVSFLWAGQNMTKLVFLIFKVSLFAVSQSHNLRSSRFTVSSIVTWDCYPHIEYLYHQQIKKNWSFSEHSWISLIQIRKSSGPKTEPCGTPKVIFFFGEIKEPIWVVCVRSSK